jgi:hypothetical protein
MTYEHVCRNRRYDLRRSYLVKRKIERVCLHRGLRDTLHEERDPMRFRYELVNHAAQGLVLP